MEKKIPNDTLKEVCKMGQAADCCRYIIVGERGIECAKGTVWQDIVDGNIKNMVAQGDNCEGILFKKGSKANQEDD